MKTLALKKAPGLYLIPFFAAYLVFWSIPLALGFSISLQEDNLFGEPGFNGLKNFAIVLTDGRFYHALWNTAFYALVLILLTIPLALFLAHLLMRSKSRWKGWVSLSLLLPGLTSPTVLGFLFILIFNGKHGILNSLFLTPFGIETVDWLKDPSFIKASLILQGVWRWAGFIAYFFLATMEGIPRTYYEIARTEGAGWWRTFLSVTLPHLRHILLFVCVFLFLDAFILFEGGYVLLGGSGGTADAGLLFVAYTYFRAFSMGQFGASAAMSFTLVPVFILLLYLLSSLYSRRGGRSIP